MLHVDDAGWSRAKLAGYTVPVVKNYTTYYLNSGLANPPLFINFNSLHLGHSTPLLSQECGVNLTLFHQM